MANKFDPLSDSIQRDLNKIDELVFDCLHYIDEFEPLGLISAEYLKNRLIEMAKKLPVANNHKVAIY